MTPRKNSSEPSGKVKMGQKSSKKKAKDSSSSVLPHALSSSSSFDRREDLKKIACSTTSNSSFQSYLIASEIVSCAESSLLSRDESNYGSSGESGLLFGDESDDGESPSSEELPDRILQLNLSSNHSDSTVEGPERDTNLPCISAGSTEPSHPISKDAAELSKPPAISFYIPREIIPPKTRDATKQSIKPFQRIKRVTKSKLFSHSITDDTIWKMKRLQNQWDSIKNLKSVDQMLALKKLNQPILINLKVVELKPSFMNYIATVSDFNSCFVLFDILGVIALSKFEYHKTEVMMEVATPQFLNTLQLVVNAFHTDLPEETQFTRFIENFVDVYVDVYLQSDGLITDGLSTDLINIIESCLELLKNNGNSECVEYLDQLRTIIDSRDSLIRANSCFPFDILSEESVENNIIDGPFDNFDQYLSIHYRLLKEDFQNSLREGILQYLKSYHGNFRKTINHHLTIYPTVTLSCCLTTLAVKYKIFFHDPALILRLQDPAQRCFLTGALLILTPCPSASGPAPFEYYYLVRVEDSSPLEREKSYIFVSMVLGPPNFTSTITLMMAEPNQLFEPYYRVLNMIRSLDSSQFPLTRYIAGVETDVFPPAYMSPSAKLKIGAATCSLWEDETWPNPEDIQLNTVQLEGLKLALRSELAIIQGPPGTGKTYLSQKIVEVLIQNKNLWHKPHDEGAGLILVVCFKNQSLDQLLSGLIKAGKKVLRVGTQSKVEMLDEYNLKTLEFPKHSRIYTRMRSVLGTEQRDLMNELNESIEIVRNIENIQGLIKLDVLSNFLHLSEENFNYLYKHFEEWLIDLPIPVTNFNKVESILLELGVDDVNDGESLPSLIFNFYRVTVQEIKDKLFVLNSKIDCLKQAGATEYVDDLLEAVAYYVQYLSFMEEHCYELNRPLTCDMQMKMMHLKRTFELPECQPRIEKLPLEQRWLLYRAWIDDLYQFHSNEIRSLTRKSQDLNLRFVEIEELLNIRKIAQCDAEIIGMTTTVAAKYYKMMDCLKPKIVLVEEAAEVVEGHTIASLSNHCEHLILVGDHKQLRPLTSSHLIGKEAHLDISMYERLVRNGFPHCTLNTQYRMRPEIASLIAPAVYPDLINDPSVYKLPHVLGVCFDLYLVDHSVREDVTPDVVSKWNRHEAEFHLALCNYLVKQGYQPSQITILATYSEQEKYFNKEKLNYPELEDVLMGTVDSFQGKENDIILLSLVRSNAEGNIGFLAQKNRINVALSRAKRGLFITGNSKSLLAKGGLWHEVVDVLSKNNAIGTSLPLKCKNHGKVTRVTTPGDIRALKGGGCSRKCGAKIECGHNCINLCHPLDPDHKDIFKCSNLCNKKMECSHSCSLTCHFANEFIKCFCERCSPKTKCEFKFPCGHICASMAHAEDVEHKDKFQCFEICNTVLNCGHICSSLCHMEDYMHTKRYKCPIICEGQLFCGHKCQLNSRKKHECSKHKSGCLSTCGLEMPCGHVCRRICHNKDRSHEDEFKCIQCGKTSSTKAPNVDALLKSESRSHFIELQPEKCLHGEALNLNCDKTCGFKHSCGHQCFEKCHSSADNHKEKCKICAKIPANNHGLELNSKNECGFEYICGHFCSKKCLHSSDYNHSKPCRRSCGLLLKCGHRCNQLCHFKEQLDHTSRRCKKCNKELQNSPKTSNISVTDEFQKISICSFKYPCGHTCRKESKHLEDASHNELCKQPSNKYLSCGHGIKQLCCFKEQLDLSRRCEICELTNPKMCGFKFNCGHLCAKMFQHRSGKRHRHCVMRCRERLSCGHMCQLGCHPDNPSAHDTSHCKKCNKELRNSPKASNISVTDEFQNISICSFKYPCGHKCRKESKHLEDASHNELCKQPCNKYLSCGHGIKLLCCFKEQLDLSRRCEICELTNPKMCGFKFNCGHLCAKMFQHRSGKRHLNCFMRCRERLSCGHMCQLGCHPDNPSAHDTSHCKKCNKELRNSPKASNISVTDEFRNISICSFKYPCGHTCRKESKHLEDASHNELCIQPCNKSLSCGHLCKFECHSSVEHGSRDLCGRCI